MTEDRRAYWTQELTVYGSALRRYFIRRGKHSADADDLAQEVYLRLLRSEANSGVRIRNPEAYLYTIAANLLRERAFLLSRGESVALDDVVATLASPEINGEENLVRSERERELTKVIDELSGRSRAALIMHYRDGLTYKDIAEEMGVTVHAVKKNICRGVQMCRHKMTKHLE